MKFKNITDEDMTLRGVDFPAGKPVEVEDEALAAKVAVMPEFEQVKRGRKKNDQDSA
jgi:ubiquitin